MSNVSCGGALRWTAWVLGCGPVLLAACTGSPPPAPEPQVQVPRSPLSLRFEPISLPADEPATEVIASKKVRVGDTEHAVTWTPLLREGQRLANGPYGVLVDAQGRPLERPTCGKADYGGLIEAHGQVFHVGHLECEPGAIWLARLQQDEQGALTPIEGWPVDLAPVHGGKDFCAGDVTLWGTLLSAEEYEPNAAHVSVGGVVEDQPVGSYDPERMATFFVPPHRPYPYDYGWVVETHLTDAQGGARAVKRRALGRFSHELARVMPDRRTVYLSDDGTNGGLFLFVADTAGDLSAGHLYAARFTQTSDADGGQGTLSWIDLGHATDAQVEQAMANGTLHFGDVLQQVAEDPEKAACPEGTSRVVDTWGSQCLAFVPGLPEPIAARLETRRVAGMKGATTELRKAEGMAHDPDHDMLYLAISSIDRGMLRGSGTWDHPDLDHIGVSENRCGGVYALPLAGEQQDTAGQPIDSAYVATHLRGFVLGRPDGFGCADGLVANPDNLAYLPGSGTLLIAEDTPHHPNNRLWAVDVDTLHAGGMASITPILAAPPGAEVTGIDWFQDVGGHGYLTTTVQHPWEGRDEAESLSAEAKMSVFGVWGPFPPLRTKAP